jgi:hypothetical protein
MNSVDWLPKIADVEPNTTPRQFWTGFLSHFFAKCTKKGAISAFSD